MHMTDPPPNGPWLTREQAAEYLAVVPRTIDRYAREGHLTRHYMARGRTPRFLAAEVHALPRTAPAGDPT